MFASRKGGTGKTVLACNLAVAAAAAGRHVICLDYTIDQSLSAWFQTRGNVGPELLVPRPQPENLRRTLAACRAAQYEICIIDTPPVDEPWITDMMALSDLVVIPLRPSAHDLRALGLTLKHVHQARTPFRFVLTQTIRSQMLEAARRELARHGPLTPVTLGLRNSYAETSGDGRGVIESEDAKARAEIEALWADLSEALDAQATGKGSVRATPEPHRDENETPAPKGKKLSVIVDRETYSRLRLYSARTEVSHQDVLDRALREHLDRVAPV